MCSAMMFWTELSYWRKAPKAGHHHFKHSQCGCPLQYISMSQLTMDLFHLMYVFFLSSFPRNMFTGLDCINIYKYTTAGDYPIRSSNWLPFESTYVHPRIWWGSCWWTFMVFCIVLCLVFSFCLFLSFMANVARI